MSNIGWLSSADIRPYVFVRPESHIAQPGHLHALDWFTQEPIFKNPLEIGQLPFANRVLHLESGAFGPKSLEMPRWVFYDCACIPGFIAGFAQRTSTLPESLRKFYTSLAFDEWSPLSLFIIIPTMVQGEWAAHNLCSVNPLLPKADQYYGLGFLTKAFGLWYANVKVCVGFTQWASPAIHLHSHYGDFEILTAYTPLHSFPRTVTYRCQVNTEEWHRFFTRVDNADFHKIYEPAGFSVDPVNDESLISFQQKLERKEGPFYLDAVEVKGKKLEDALTVYRRKNGATRSR